MAESHPAPVLGIVIVTFNSSDVILDCLESLLAVDDVSLYITVVDNASTDGTVKLIRDWAVGDQHYDLPADIPFQITPCRKPVALKDKHAQMPGITLIESEVNGGFAAGVNMGLRHLAQIQLVDRFWVLNPDCVVPGQTPGALASFPAPRGGFSLLGGRINYLDPSALIQSDGGKINWLTGVTQNLNFKKPAQSTPKPIATEADFISGASLVVSRDFYETAGPMPEEYFLYYEEVAWAMCRDQMPLVLCPDAMVYHRAGTAIGSQRPNRIASAFSLFFLYRSRMKFLQRHRVASLPFSYAFGLAKSVQMILKGYPAEAYAVLKAIHGLAPPAQVRARLSDAAARLAFDRPQPRTPDAKV